MLFLKQRNNRHKNSLDDIEKNSSDSLHLQQLILQMLQEQTKKQEDVGAENCQDRLQLVEKRLRKQENMLEDLLEQTEEAQNELEKIKDSISEALETRRQDLQRQDAAGLQQEQKLLETIAVYDEYLQRIYLNEGEITSSQQERSGVFASEASGTPGKDSRERKIIFQVLDQYLAGCGIKRMEGSGQKVDFETMTVLQAFETDRSDLENTVKETILSGWLYKGKVFRKAKVTAYCKEKSKPEQ